MNNAVVLELFATISEIDFANSPDRVLQIFRVALETYGLHSFLITGLPVPHDSEWDRAILWDGWPRSGSCATNPKVTSLAILAQRAAATLRNPSFGINCQRTA